MTPTILAVTLLAGQVAPSQVERSASRKLKVVVLDFSTPGLGDAEGKSLSENLAAIVSTQVQKLGHEAISSADIKAMLVLDRQKDLLGCADDTSCLAEIGGALGGDLLVTGGVGRVGESYTLLLSLINAKDVVVKGRFQTQTATPAELVPAVEIGVHEIFGLSPAAAGQGGSSARSLQPPPMPSDLRGEDRRLWKERTHGYERYKETAASASFAPLPFEQWETEVMPRQNDWLSFFSYRNRTLDRGQEPLAFAVWHEAATRQMTAIEAAQSAKSAWAWVSGAATILFGIGGAAMLLLPTDPIEQYNRGKDPSLDPSAAVARYNALRVAGWSAVGLASLSAGTWAFSILSAPHSPALEDLDAGSSTNGVHFTIVGALP